MAAVLKVYNGSSWITALGKAWSGSAWVEKMNFYDGIAFVPLYSSGPAITVSGETISHSVSNGNTARAAVRVNVDGTIDKLVNVTFTQIDASTDWRIPNANGAGFWVQFTKGILDPAPNYNPDSTVLGTWYELDTVSRRVGYEDSGPDSESSGTITVKISDDSSGSPVLDQANYPCAATVGLPP